MPIYEVGLLQVSKWAILLHFIIIFFFFMFVRLFFIRFLKIYLIFLFDFVKFYLGPYFSIQFELLSLSHSF